MRFQITEGDRRFLASRCIAWSDETIKFMAAMVGTKFDSWFLAKAATIVSEYVGKTKIIDPVLATPKEMRDKLKIIQRSGRKLLEQLESTDGFLWEGIDRRLNSTPSPRERSFRRMQKVKSALSKLLERIDFALPKVTVPLGAPPKKHLEECVTRLAGAFGAVSGKSVGRSINSSSGNPNQTDFMKFLSGALNGQPGVTEHGLDKMIRKMPPERG